MNWFHYYPVGHGLFYCGILGDKEYSFVYDCGTKLSPTHLSPYINDLKSRMLNENQRLDFVALSHLHRDHINGLFELNKVIGFKKIYLPFLPGNEREIHFQIICQYFNFSEINSQMINQKKFSENEINQYKEELEFIFSLYKEGMDQTKISKGDFDIVIPTKTLSYWHFYFFNKTIDDETFEKLHNGLEKYFASSSYTTINEIINANNFEEIVKIYKEIFTDFKKMNNSSLILFHYPAFPDWQYILCRYMKYPFFSNARSKSISALTGDVDFDDDLVKRIEKYIPLSEVGIVQVPHHGSEKNWENFWRYFKYCDLYVVSCPSGHAKLPFYKIERDVCSCRYYEVNEDIDFSYWI